MRPTPGFPSEPTRPCLDGGALRPIAGNHQPGSRLAQPGEGGEQIPRRFAMIELGEREHRRRTMKTERGAPRRALRRLERASAAKLLDIDGITGGFNFQAAWSTAYIAARSFRQL